MITVKIGRQLQDNIRLAYAADRSTLLIGHTGTGKSESLEQAARNLGIGYEPFDLSIMEPVELVGMPLIRRNRTVYAPPARLPRKGRGIIVFEELNRAPRYVLAPTLELLTARRLNDYRLPKGWVPCAAINPDDEGYVVDVLDRALMARFMVLNVVPDLPNWLAWAEKHDIHQAVQRFVREAAKIFDPDVSSPRSWHYVSKVLHAFERGKFKRNTLLAAVAGEVGDRLAHAFLRIYRGNGGGVPSGDVVVAAYSKARAWILSMVKAGNTGALESLCHSALLHLQDPGGEEKARASRRQTANLRRLLDDLPAPFRKKILGPHPWIARKRRRRA